MSSGRDPQQAALLRAARARGLEVEDLAGEWGLDAAALRRGGEARLVLHGRTLPDLSAVADRICSHKVASKALLARLRIPTPQGMVLLDPDRQGAELEGFLQEGRRYVLKPLEGTDGRGVVLGLSGLEDLRRAWSERDGKGVEEYLLEVQVEGRDVRLQAIGGCLVAACERRPAFVVGDGRSSVRELVALRRREMRRQNPRNRLELDNEALGWLARQGFQADDVPATGTEVRLRSIANMAVGGVAIDVTGELHPRYGEWIEAVAARLELSFFALDFIASDPAEDPLVVGAHALEINARPQWLHHTFCEGRTHDIPGLILDHLFAEKGEESP